MRYRNVFLESIGYVLPSWVVSSEELEAQLAPVYDRLRLPEGRLELMSGIRQRRLWEPGVLPSEKSSAAGQLALDAAEIQASQIGAVFHCAVCRDQLEPATSCHVHRRLQLPSNCLVHDVSNACLGFLNGMILAANMIELGQIESAIIVSSEGSRELVERTILELNTNESLTRDDIKLAVASLTIGSAAVAAVLTNKQLSQRGTKLTAAVSRAYSEYDQLCRGTADQGVAQGMRPLMQTDSEQLLIAGVSAAEDCFQEFLQEASWSRDQINRTVCHQVGKAHRKALLQAIELQAENDFTSYELLGNTGSAALPVTTALATEAGFLNADDQVALMGIGSGINVVMLAVEWQTVAVAGRDEAVVDSVISRPKSRSMKPATQPPLVTDRVS
ncbi:MAG: 3-oxoacyl-ACP synthase III [Pirellulales bacterium]|nr:3-oxoacyl-ACP synthase III [Pirellulales bacterium]